MSYQISGKVLKVFPTEDKGKNGSEFLVRKLWIETSKSFNGNTYFNSVEIQFKNKGCALLDRVNPGEKVNIDFDITGNQHTGNDGVERVYNSLGGWRINPVGQGDEGDDIQESDTADLGASDPNKADDDLPF